MKPTFMPSFNLKVTVTINIEAADFLEAAEHQRRLEQNIAPLLEAYPTANIAVGRTRSRDEGARQGGPKHISSGNVKQYG